jgi:BASS family bile acid:Na+ symporter
MNVVMPVFAVALVAMFDIHPAVKIALVVLSVSPVPPLFPRTALKKGCRENYALGLLVAMALLAIVVIPVTMEVLERVFRLRLEMTARAVAVLVVRTVFAPVLIGICIRHLTPSFANRAAKPVGVFASVLLVVSLLPVLFVSARALLSLIGNGTILALAAFTLIGLIVGYVFAGPDLHEKRVLALATSLRHPGVAVAIAHANFPRQRLAVPAIVLYLIVSGIVTAIAAKRSKTRRNARETEQPWAA